MAASTVNAKGTDEGDGLEAAISGCRWLSFYLSLLFSGHIAANVLGRGETKSHSDVLSATLLLSKLVGAMKSGSRHH
jgi:hypothetical protein